MSNNYNDFLKEEYMIMRSNNDLITDMKNANS